MAGGTPLPDNIMEAISLNGLMSIANQPAILSNLALSNVTQNTNLSQQNALSFQQTQNGLQATILAKLVNTVLNPGPIEAASVGALFSRGGASEELAMLKALLDVLNGGGGSEGGGSEGGGGSDDGGGHHQGSIKPGDPGS